jgi:TATA-binding protein-associated factor
LPRLRTLASSIVVTIARVAPARALELIVSSSDAGGLALLSHSGRDHARLGMLELIHRLLIDLASAAVAPYLVLIVRPLLQRLNDQCAAVRECASRAFAEAMTLVPIERAAPNPCDMDAALAHRRSEERRVLDQLIDGASIERHDVSSLGIVAQLRPYQQDGVDWLHFLHAMNLNGILADDMGALGGSL